MAVQEHQQVEASAALGGWDAGPEILDQRVERLHRGFAACRVDGGQGEPRCAEPRIQSSARVSDSSGLAKRVDAWGDRRALLYGP